MEVIFMNFFPNYPVPNMMIPNEGNIINNDMNYMNQIFNKLNEYEGRIKRLEQRITRLENEHNNSDYNYLEPDNSLYMI